MFYNINGHILERVTSNPYIGAELTNTMSWDKQVPKVATKGNKALGFIRTILLLVQSGGNSSCSSNVVTVPGSLE
jgi:hypothetical protein